LQGQGNKTILVGEAEVAPALQIGTFTETNRQMVITEFFTAMRTLIQRVGMMTRSLADEAL